VPEEPPCKSSTSIFPQVLSQGGSSGTSVGEIFGP